MTDISHPSLEASSPDLPPRPSAITPVALTEAVLDQDIDTFGADGEFEPPVLVEDGPA